jgi:Skp family chaperone for outer membrane proteins
MRVFVVAVALSIMLSAAPSYALAPAGAPQAAPAAQTQKPPAPAPQTQKPPAPAAAAPAVPQPPTPRFQEGMKYAFVYLDQIAGFSNPGKVLNAKVQGLQEQKVKELQDRNKVLQAAQEKLEKGASVMNDVARAQLQTDIERQQRDLQRASEDAQQEVQALAQQLQQEFLRVVIPAIEKVAKAKQVHFVFNAQESGLVWADATMDLTAEVIRELDVPAAAGAKPAPPAAAPSPVQIPVKP